MTLAPLIFAGLAAPSFVYYPALLFANAFGAADLAVAIATGIRLVLRKEPAMRAIGTFPPAMIPLFGVGPRPAGPRS